MQVKPSEKVRPEEDIEQKNIDLLNNPDKVKPYIGTKKKKKASKSEFYVDPDEFKACLLTYYETEDDNCRNYEKLGTIFVKIARKLATSSCFSSYSWKEDMISEGLSRCVKALKGKKYSFAFNSSPFSYYTQVLYWAFISVIKNEKKYGDLVKNLRDKEYDNAFKDCDDTRNIYIRPEADQEIFD